MNVPGNSSNFEISNSKYEEWILYRAQVCVKKPSSERLTKIFYTGGISKG